MFLPIEQCQCCQNAPLHGQRSAVPTFNKIPRVPHGGSVSQFEGICALEGGVQSPPGDPFRCRGRTKGAERACSRWGTRPPSLPLRPVPTTHSDTHMCCFATDNGGGGGLTQCSECERWRDEGPHSSHQNSKGCTGNIFLGPLTLL